MPIPNPDDEDRSSAVLPVAAVFGLLALEFAIMFVLVVIGAICNAGGG